MDRDERLTSKTVDLRPIVGLLHELPEALVERLTVQAIRDHRELVERAENLFQALPEEIRSGKAACGDEQFDYLQATIAMHAQMSALTTLLDILGYTPRVDPQPT
jgi:hypothetical protein